MIMKLKSESMKLRNVKRPRGFALPRRGTEGNTAPSPCRVKKNPQKNPTCRKKREKNHTEADPPHGRAEGAEGSGPNWLEPLQQKFSGMTELPRHISLRRL